jgi:creatinine amidohydrolase
MTGTEAAKALADRPVLLLPLGSYESHGPALPMGDYVAAERIAVAIAQRAQQQGTPCLVLPALPFGGADYFGSVPGAVALRQSTLLAVLVDILDALLRHQLTRLVVINGHGGNSQVIHQATLAVRHRHGVVIPSFYLWKVAAALMAADGVPPVRLGHGADPVASIAMHLFGLEAPTSVTIKPERVLGLDVVDFGCVEFDGVRIDVPVEFDAVAPDGVRPGCDASKATAAEGMMLVERLTRIGARLAAHVLAESP